MASMSSDTFTHVLKFIPGKITDSYCCMHDVIRKIFIVNSITVEKEDGDIVLATDSGFLCFDETMWFIVASNNQKEIDKVEFESAFVCISADIPKKFFKDAFPDTTGQISRNEMTNIYSSPSMLFSWTFTDTVPLSHDTGIPEEADYHVDVKAVAKSISKYMRRNIASEWGDHKPIVEVNADVAQSVSVPNALAGPVFPRQKRSRDAREFREKILSTGAQAEFYVWNHIKAVCGDSATLDWWVSSTKRQFFPQDVSEIDDGLGCDFVVPVNPMGLFGSTKGSSVYVEVKGTGGRMESDRVTFEITRNELQKSKEMSPGNEFIVVVISCVNERPKIEAIVRDFDNLDLTPTRFLANIPRKVKEENGDAPLHTKSSWF